MAPVNGTGNVLEIHDLSVHYHDGTEALAGVSLAIRPGQRAAIIGPNGAGKTTLLLAAMNAVHYHGRIIVDGIELSRSTQAAARGRCGMTFQNADDQLFMPTLLDDVAFGPLNQRLSADQAQAQAAAAIAAVGLAGMEARAAHHLSGGQRRLAALATILSMSVKLLLLDEPAANLDFRSRQRLMETLAARGEALLLATHDLDLVEHLCNRIIVLDRGHIVADGPTGRILADRPLLARHGLA
ncbi:MAG: ABC transporter ATP-binding protein [Phycisphaerae bacterium]